MLELTGTQVIIGLLSLGASIIVGIILYRLYHHKANQSTDSSSQATIIKLSNRTKYADKSFLRQRGQRLGVGLSCSLLFAVMAISWTVYEKEVYTGDYEVYDEIVEVIPRTDHKPPAKKIPPPPVVIEEVEEDLIEEPDDLVDTTIDDDTSIDDDYIIEEPAIATPPPPLPLPEEPKDDIEEIRNFVEQMPRFGDCSDKACSDKELMNYIYQKIRYPNIARENGIKGRVTAEFVVEKNGKVSGIKVLRGIGGGCDKEVERVLTIMNKETTWQPGKQNGKAVRVMYRIPVTFKLD